MKKLRLLITKDCSKDCSGCSNKNFDLDNLPIVTHYDYDEVIITGGEPLSSKCLTKTASLLHYLKYVDINPNRRVYVYTANTNWADSVIPYCDGLTVTLHNKKDANNFFQYDLINIEQEIEIHQKDMSLRLNIFKGIIIPNSVNLFNWKVKKDIEWIDNCPIPKNEVFMRTKTI